MANNPLQYTHFNQQLTTKNAKRSSSASASSFLSLSVSCVEHFCFFIHLLITTTAIATGCRI